MATPRKRTLGAFYKQPESILRDDWTNDEVATFVRLQAHLNLVSSYGGARPGYAVIPKISLLGITGKYRTATSLKLLRRVCELAEISISETDRSVIIDWPEFADRVGTDFSSDGIQRLRGEIAALRAEIVQALLLRDGPGCRECGKGPPYHIDHAMPLARGGDNAFGNLQLLCPNCNHSKGARVDA